MIPYQSIIVPLSATLGLSLMVERILELTQNIVEPILSRFEGRKVPKADKSDQIVAELKNNYEADKLSQEVEAKAEKAAKERIAIKAKLQSESNPQTRKELREKLVELEKDGEWDERVSINTILVTPATDPDDGTTIKSFVLQLLGFAVGIVLAHYSGIQLFNSFLASSNLMIPPWLDYLFTGLLIGGGSQPMNILMRFVTQRKIVGQEPMVASAVEERLSLVAKNSGPAIIFPVQSMADEGWLDFAYQGGVDPAGLEGIHKRERDPELIIFHHTAMNSKCTFDEVVRVIKSRQDSRGNPWQTGYHCVITVDGAVYPFCRWDRYGNHAVGYNRSSLGIAFNGNFETDPKVSFSNYDGRYGATYPTEIQLKAGARVMALWSFLYKIDLDFGRTIIPHHKISSKTCPGSAFHFDELNKWVDFFFTQWNRSEAIKERIETFRAKPFLYSHNKEA